MAEVALGVTRWGMADRDSRTRIYESALDLMGRNGIAATSTRDILGAAGIRNPSAISYYFGSKAGLVAELASELMGGSFPLLGRQLEVAEQSDPVDVGEWIEVIIDLAVDLVSSERGCLLARLWWEFDGYLEPESLESFVWSDGDVPKRWRDAVARTFPHLPMGIGISRNVTAIRTVGWMLARMAAMNLEQEPFVVHPHPRFRAWLTEIVTVLLDRADDAHRPRHPDGAPTPGVTGRADVLT